MSLISYIIFIWLILSKCETNSLGFLTKSTTTYPIGVSLFHTPSVRIPIPLDVIIYVFVGSVKKKKKQDPHSGYEISHRWHLWSLFIAQVKTEWFTLLVWKYSQEWLLLIFCQLQIVWFTSRVWIFPHVRGNWLFQERGRSF